MKFIRRHGRIIPIHEKGDSRGSTAQQKAAESKARSAVGAGAGVSVAGLLTSVADPTSMRVQLAALGGMLVGGAIQHAGLEYGAKHGTKFKRSGEELKKIASEHKVSTASNVAAAGSGAALSLAGITMREQVVRAMKGGKTHLGAAVQAARGSKIVKGALIASAGLGAAAIGLNIVRSVKTNNRIIAAKRGTPDFESLRDSSRAGYGMIGSFLGGAGALAGGYVAAMKGGLALRPHTAKFADWRKFKNATNVGRGRGISGLLK
jgi:hypothetical protein